MTLKLRFRNVASAEIVSNCQKCQRKRERERERESDEKKKKEKEHGYLNTLNELIWTA